jgi:DNA-binding CsgD family transcriptional regulator
MHQLELDHNEKEIVSLKNEKLENEVNFKNKELATTTMHLVQRGKLMTKIKEGLIEIQEAVDVEKNKELVKVLKLINEAEKNDSDWDHFAIHFDQVHSDFLFTLKNKFPSLSSTDLKVCAYLKMNLTSKEIAQLMSVTIGAVEVSRYRLRKKLNLPPNVNLFDYLVESTSKTI